MMPKNSTLPDFFTENEFIVLMFLSKITKCPILTLFAMGLLSSLTSCNTTTSPTSAEQQPVAATSIVASEPEEVATEAVSPSSAYSRKLRGVFIKSVTCTPNRIRLGDSINVEIKEAWLERLWAPKFGGLFGEDDFTQGYAQDSASEYPRTQLVMAFTPTSKLGHFDNYSWQLNLANDTYKRHGFSRSRSNQLIMHFLRSNPSFPMKFNLLTCPVPGPSCEQVPVSTVMLSE